MRFALALIALACCSACLVIGSNSSDANADPASCVCHARNGGESDHTAGQHWFNSDEFCGCASVAGTPETSCRLVCEFQGVRFVDSDGIVCSCSSSGAITCSGDANENGSCTDADHDGICDR
jgi:hypothetical protein